MNKDALMFWCQTMSDLSHVPMRLYDDKILVKEYSTYGNDYKTFLSYDDFLLQTKTEYTVQFYISDSSFMYGEIIDKYSLSRIILGPIPAIPPSQDVIKDIILTNSLSLDLFKELKAIYHLLPVYDALSFIKFIVSSNTSINHTVLSPELFFDDKSIEKTTEIFINAKSKPSKNITKHISYDYEKRFLFCIRNGLIDEIDNVDARSYDGAPGKMSNDPMKQLKHLLFTMNTLCTRAAIEGGLDPETAYTLSDVYTQKIDLCNDTIQLQTISRQLRYDYCKRVHDLKYPQTSDLTIQKALKYIAEHVTEKLSTTDIADNLGISRGYLSTRFKDVTGVSVTDYINVQKIREAKQLLKFSDKSLVSISNYLSFSSQSYFQNVFKSFTGKTPTEYRKEKDN